MRRPWNLIDVPVYSLTTYTESQVNMNICTYVSVVSMKPKMYAIAIDYHSQTYQNLLVSDTCVLQLLQIEQTDIVKPLGKKSGKNYDKTSYLHKRKLLTQWDGLTVLKGTNAWIRLAKMHQLNVDGDHELFFFTVEKFKVNAEENVLMFQELIRQGVIL